MYLPEATHAITASHTTRMYLSGAMDSQTTMTTVPSDNTISLTLQRQDSNPTPTELISTKLHETALLKCVKFTHALDVQLVQTF